MSFDFRNGEKKNKSLVLLLLVTAYSLYLYLTKKKTHCIVVPVENENVFKIQMHAYEMGWIQS